MKEKKSMLVWFETIVDNDLHCDIISNRQLCNRRK